MKVKDLLEYIQNLDIYTNDIDDVDVVVLNEEIDYLTISGVDFFADRNENINLIIIKTNNSLPEIYSSDDYEEAKSLYDDSKVSCMVHYTGNYSNLDLKEKFIYNCQVRGYNRIWALYWWEKVREG